MRPKVYVETTVVRCFTARPSRDIVVAGRQQVTRDWWRDAGRRFELVVSPLVLDEAGSGDGNAARERMAALGSATSLDMSTEAVELGRRMVRTGTVPTVAVRDAGHIAIAVVHGVDYLVTWNLRHIANAVARPAIERICRQAGFEPTVICTPDELMDDPNRPTVLTDPIVAEVRRVRDEQAARAGYDLATIFRNAQARQRASSRECVRYPPRRIADASEQTAGQSEGSG